MVVVEQCLCTHALQVAWDALAVRLWILCQVSIIYLESSFSFLFDYAFIRFLCPLDSHLDVWFSFIHCLTVLWNLTAQANQVAHVNCGNCRTTLMYPYGASSVKCAVCQFVSNVNVSVLCSFICFRHLSMVEFMYNNYLFLLDILTNFWFYLLIPQMGNGRVPLPTNRPNGTMPSTSNVSYQNLCFCDIVMLILYGT